jgi:hypothetical protein
VHGCFGSDGKLAFAPAAFKDPATDAGTQKPIGFHAVTVRTASTMFPQNRFKERTTGILIGKLLSQLVDIHFFASLGFWRRLYQPSVTDPVTTMP